MSPKLGRSNQINIRKITLKLSSIKKNVLDLDAATIENANGQLASLKTFPEHTFEVYLEVNKGQLKKSPKIYNRGLTEAWDRYLVVQLLQAFRKKSLPYSLKFKRNPFFLDKTLDDKDLFKAKFLSTNLNKITTNRLRTSIDNKTTSNNKLT